MADYYVHDERVIVDEDENGGSYRNQQMTTSRETGRGPLFQQLPSPSIWINDFLRPLRLRLAESLLIQLDRNFYVPDCEIQQA